MERAKPAVVLAVDDEGENTEMARRALAGRADLRTLVASSAAEALAILRERRIDLMLVDHRMPDMTGAELLRRVKRLGYATKAIMVTAYPEDEEVVNARERGLLVDVIAKPWSAEELTAAIDAALETHGLE